MLASKKTTIWRLKKSQSNDKFLEECNVFQLSHGIKNIHHSSKQVATTTYMLEKKLFAAASFEGL